LEISVTVVQHYIYSLFRTKCSQDRNTVYKHRKKKKILKTYENVIKTLGNMQFTYTHTENI